MDTFMSEWMNGRKDGWMEEQMNGWIHIIIYYKKD